jgi:hypothetical protein
VGSERITARYRPTPGDNQPTTISPRARLTATNRPSGDTPGVILQVNEADRARGVA